MNFKKYHVSKNLLNFDDLKDAPSGTIYTLGGTGYSVPHLLTLDLKPNTTYTLSSNYVRTSSNLNIVYFQYADIEYAVSSDNSPSFTTTTGIVKIGFFDTRTGADEFLSGAAVLMLNEGSTPLPYEPYSSEVWHDSHYIMGTSTDTITTLPAVIYANDTTATIGLKGNMSQTGTPTPSAPIQPSECGDRTGNLFDITNTMFACGFTGSLINDNEYVDFTVNGNDIEINVKVSDRYSAYVLLGFCENERTYTVTASVTPAKNWGVYATNSTQLPIDFSDSSKFATLVPRSQNASKTFTVPQGLNYIWISTPAATAYIVNISNIMLNTGSTALPYEPYGYKIPISSANTTTPVYLGEVESTRRIKKLVFDGTENWLRRQGEPPNIFFIEFYSTNFIRNKGVCTHYINQDSGSFNDLEDKHFLVQLSIDNIRSFIGIRDSSYTEHVDFKSYLAAQYAAGTPVTVWYVLATEETAVVNEPIRKIGDYADEVSGITIPTIAGADTLSIGTILQPSEVTATYKGWHTVQSVHEYDYLLASNPLCGIDTYKDELNLATGACTRQIQKLVLDGTGGWKRDNATGVFSLDILNSLSTSSQSGISSHWQFEQNRGVYTLLAEGHGCIRNSYNELWIRDNNFPTVADFKSYLAAQYAAGTPVTVWYVLATPTTETITIPSGLSGTEEGYLNQTVTPTPTNPIYPTANEVKVWT